MALVKKSSNPQRTLILSCVLIAVGLVAVYYLVVLPIIDKNASNTAGQDTTGQQNRDIRALNDKLIPDLQDLLADPRFVGLKQYGDTRIDVAPTGRTNPFLPF